MPDLSIDAIYPVFVPGTVSTDGSENQCVQCNKTFRSKSALQKHLAVHKQIKYRYRLVMFLKQTLI